MFFILSDQMTEKNDKMSSESVSPDTSETDSIRDPIRRTRSSTKSTSPSLITYTPDELAAFRLTALSSKWPIFLDESFKNARGHWDPDRWHQNRKRGSTPPPDPEKPVKPSTDRPTSSLSADGKVNFQQKSCEPILFISSRVYFTSLVVSIVKGLVSLQ
jgi:hypothetical protein